MSDIEKIKKINEMTLHLKKHGFAHTFDEASQQAHQVFQENMAAADKQQPQGGETMTNSEEVAKLSRNLDMFKASIQQQVEVLKGDLHSVVTKMNDIIKAINELEKLKDSVTNIDEGDEKQQRLAPKVVKKPVSEKPNSHPRSGEFQPGDVDISKTFYFGNKR